MEKVGELESVRWYRLTGQVDGKLTAKSVSNFQVGMKLIFSHSRSNRGYSKPIEIPIEVLEYDAMTKQISLLFDYAEKCKIQHFRCLFFSNSPENEYSYDPILHQFVKRDVLQKSKLLSQVSPFVKKQEVSIANSSSSLNPNSKDATTLRIASRSDLDDDFDFEKFRESLIDTVVGLSHSNKMSEKETLCHARIQCVEICNSRIVITVLNEETIDIWEDLDVWIYPIELYQNTEKSENLKSQITEIENDIYGQLNDGWKYLRGEFKRFRTKDEGEWRNEYSTVLQFKLIDENDNALLKFIQRGDKLRLSLDSDIPGPIFVRVTQVFHNSEDVCQIDQNTIYVAIIGFENTSTKMRLSKELPYYLSIDRDSQKSEAEKKEKENMSESGSCSSEDVVLHGYSLIENVDELCEIIGSLKLVESDVNSYADINGNQQTHCRLSFSVENRKSLKRFEWLEGRFVKLTSENDEGTSILAMVTRVMNDIIVLTIEGVPEKYTKFEISKRFDYFIQIDHDFERFVVEKRNICKKTDVWLKLQEEMKRNDLKTDKNWIEIDKNTSNKRRFCTFTAKRRCYDWIKDGEIVLLSQCWIVHGIVRRKTNFLYAKKCDKTASYKQNDPKIVCFEILIDENDNNNNNNNWIPNIPQAYYFITIDSSFLFENGCGWQKFIIVDTENRRIFQRESAETIDFDVVHWNIELLTDQKNNDIIHNELSEEIRTCKSIEGSSRSISIPDRVNTEISDISIIYGRIESLKIHDFNVHLKEIGFVNIFHISAEGNQLRIFIDISDECNSDEMSTFFEIGRYIFLSLDHTSDNLNIIGKVHEQRSATVFMISIDSELSNSLFWSVWIRYMYSFNIRSMKMLCHIHE